MNVDRLIFWMVVVLTLCRYLLATSLELTEDEALLWKESKHLAPFYIDHGPLAPLQIRFGTWIFGDSLLGIRFCNPLQVLLASWFFYLLARSVYRQEVARWSLVIFQLVPLANMAGIFMIDVGLALSLSLIGFWCLWRGLHRVNRWHGAWWGGGIAFGLVMTLSLPSVVLLIGVILAVSLIERWRAQWRRPGIWILLGTAMTVPIGLCLESGHGELSLRQALQGFGFHPAQLAIGGWRWFFWSGPIIGFGLGWVGYHRKALASEHGPSFLAILGLVALIGGLLWSSVFSPWRYVWWVGMTLCLIVICGEWMQANIDLEWKRRWQRWALILTGGLATVGVNTENLKMMGIPCPNAAATPRLAQGWAETSEAVTEVLLSGKRRAPEGLFVIAESPAMAALLDFWLPEDSPIYRPAADRYPRVHVVESTGWDSPFDLWPGYSHEIPGSQLGSPYLDHTALYITNKLEDDLPANLIHAFKSTDCAAVLEIKRRGRLLHVWRLYHVYEYRGLPL